MRKPRIATTADGQKYFTARVRTETKNATTQIAKSDSALARHAKNTTNTPIPNILGPTSIFIDALEINEIDINIKIDPSSIDCKPWIPGLASGCP